MKEIKTFILVLVLINGLKKSILDMGYFNQKPICKSKRL